MIKLRAYSVVAILFLALPGVKSQYNDTIMQAMTDELNRNKEELQYKDYNKPFYISYQLYDLSLKRYSATLGGNNLKLENKQLRGNVRVMIGDYEITDENFNDQTNQFRHNDGNQPLPEVPDYDGIRRYFWMATNNVYKNATESYRNKKAAMKQQNMSVDDMPAHDFSKEEPQVYIVKEEPEVKRKLNLGKLVEELSQEFLNYPEIIESVVYIFETNMYYYYTNTEGTKLAFPEQQIHIQATCSAFNNMNETVTENIYLDAMNADNLLPVDSLKSYMDALSNNVIERSQIGLWQDSYTGPVLFENQAVYQLFINPAFTKGNLIATRESLVKTNTGIVLENQTTLEKKMDKRVASSFISVFDVPKLKSYNNVPLMGHYNIDAQGVIPNDTLTLIDSGMLKALLTNRTPVKSSPVSNGHSRISNNDGNTSLAIAPGNIFIKSNKTTDKKTLKQKLTQLANDEGVDYAIVIRAAIKGNLIGPLDIIKVDLETGNETRLTGVNIGSINSESLRDIIATSQSEQILNTHHNYPLAGRYRAITPASFIYPDAILVEDIELTGQYQTVKKNPPVIPNPLTVTEKP